MERRRTPLIIVLSAVLVTVLVFGTVVVVTGFVACGISGCSGGGFGPSFAPSQAQVGLMVAGLTLLPLALLGLRGRSRRYRLAGTAGVVAAGSVLAMIVLGLGPNGCPWGQSRATGGTGAFSPGALTCSADRDAVPPATDLSDDTGGDTS